MHAIAEPLATELADLTFLFSDIEGSTRLWEQDPERMRHALAAHDRLAHEAIRAHHGWIVKTTGDGVHAAFENPVDALHATLRMQLALDDPAATNGLALRVRCGLHRGWHERRGNDFYGRDVNRAARIGSVAHGGQILVSQAVAEAVADRLPAGAALRELGRVRLRDLASPELVSQLLHPKLRAEFPALRSLEATPNNLAQQLNAFIGRDADLAALAKLLQRHRLVTLVGTGGIGKSRLSVQLGAEVLDRYADGVWFVELAPIEDAALVPQALADVLGVKEDPGRPVLEALLRFVRERRLLIVIDNCEHLVAAAADLAKRLLQAGAGVTVLATSREALHIAGECAFAVPALTAPEPGASPDVESLARHSAVQLFVDRARAALPSFRIGARNAAALAEICRRLDGIPLALELAAARVRALPVETIAARLRENFRLLATTDQTVLPRQRTLRVLIDWSHDLLGEPERRLFRRLSVFAGGWTLEAAEAVCADDALAADEVLDLLALLVEKSLATLDADQGRYRLLETVRQYARERLVDAGEEAAQRSAHLAHQLALVEAARPQLFGPEQGRWLARLDGERENLLGAHAWALQSHDAARGLRLADALRPYWVNRGLLTLGHRLLVELLAQPGLQRRDDPRCRALFGAGQLSYFMGRYLEAIGLLEESLAIARETGNTTWVGGVLQPLGTACLGAGSVDAARGHLEEALGLARERGHAFEIAAAANALAMVHRVDGRFDAAEPLYAEAVALARSMGDRESLAIGLLNQAMVAVCRQRGDAAAAMLREVLAIADEIGSIPVQQSAVEVCCGLAAERGEAQQAACFYGIAEAQARLTQLQRDPADEAFLAPRVARAREALGAPDFDAACADGRAIAPETAAECARAWLDTLA